MNIPVSKSLCFQDKYEYDDRDKLGSGGFATVFRGKNVSTKEVVAIKCITVRFYWKLVEFYFECNFGFLEIQKLWKKGGGDYETTDGEH